MKKNAPVAAPASGARESAVHDLAQRMARDHVTLLGMRRERRWRAEGEIGDGGAASAAFRSERHREAAALFRRFQASHHTGAFARGADANRQVAGNCEPLDLAGEYGLVTEVI